MKLNYEEHFTVFIDFLGFSEASEKIDDATRDKVLGLLISLSRLNGEFSLESINHENGKTNYIKPAINTFSDHIVISYPLRPIYAEHKDERFVSTIVLHQVNDHIAKIAAAALSIGFLIRGGAAIGNLYHANNVVFGEALIKAFKIESRTSIYPRVVLSQEITNRHTWIDKKYEVIKADDGLYHFNYFQSLILKSAIPGESYPAQIAVWFEQAVKIINKNLNDLDKEGSLNELAKWTWFAREFRKGLERNLQLLNAFDLSLDITSNWLI